MSKRKATIMEEKTNHELISSAEDKPAEETNVTPVVVTLIPTGRLKGPFAEAGLNIAFNMYIHIKEKGEISHYGSKNNQRTHHCW